MLLIHWKQAPILRGHYVVTYRENSILILLRASTLSFRFTLDFNVGLRERTNTPRWFQPEQKPKVRQSEKYSPSVYFSSE